MEKEEPPFVIFFREMFKKRGFDYDKIKARLYEYYNSDSKKRDKLDVYCHFYYYICKPNEDGIREELRIVGMTSLIEAMMEIDEFKDPIAYFKSQYPDSNEILDFNAFKNEYLLKHGATKKIIKYFDEYVESENVKEILSEIRLCSGGKDEPLADMKQFAKFLYQMRNDFVHRADMQNFTPLGACGSLIVVNDEAYSLGEKINIDAIMKVFEKSFVNYWNEKYQSIIK